MAEYFLSTVHDRWRQALALATPPTKILVFSPYLTSDTAETVLGGATGQGCFIYTRFSARLFAEGGSSLPTLKLLAERGCQLFDLPAIHAKMIIIPDSFASVGSQNLTHGGTQNNEATVVITDPAEVAIIRQQAEKWIVDAIPISLEMIEDMAARLPDLKAQLDALHNQLAGIDEEVRQREEQRQAAMKVERYRQSVFERVRERIGQFSQGTDIHLGLAKACIRASAYWERQSYDIVPARRDADRIVTTSPGRSTIVFDQTWPESLYDSNWQLRYAGKAFLVGKAIRDCLNAMEDLMNFIEVKGLDPVDTGRPCKSTLWLKLRLNAEPGKPISKDLLTDHMEGAIVRAFNHPGFEAPDLLNGVYMCFGNHYIHVRDFIDCLLAHFPIGELWQNNEANEPRKQS